MCREVSGTLRGLLGIDETVLESHEWRKGVQGMAHSLGSVRGTWHFLGAEAENQGEGPDCKRPCRVESKRVAP